MRKISLLNSITFLSAFLLFQIELIVSKIMLPDFGGSYLVWGSCVVFFQAVLFLGYFFAYLWIRKAGIPSIRKFYFLLFLLPLLCFPGRGFPAITRVNLSVPLVANVFWYLFFSIGAVFFVLSTSSVILQSWLSGSELPERNNPYALFALSNLGSFTALLTYPFVFEMFLDLNQQLFLWRLMYFLLLALIGLAVFKIKLSPQAAVGAPGDRRGVSGQDCARWLAFSAAGVVMFLSVTNILTYEIAPIPLLWVLPLCIYLISFVLNFKRKSWVPAWVTDKFYLTFAWSILFFFIPLMRILPAFVEMGVICWFLFHLCMFCQYQLNKTKPADLNYLPLFYLVVSLGGFLGGFFTTWVMPLISFSACEYLVGLALIAVGLAIGSEFKLMGWINVFLVFYVCVTLKIWPVLFREYNVFGLIIIFWIYKVCYARISKNPRAFLLSIILILSVTSLIYPLWTKYDYIYRHRNYYGIYEVSRKEGKILLMHGTTTHGVQYTDKDKQDQPLAYYHKLTPVGQLLGSSWERKNMGVIGLGTAGLSAYARPGEVVDYFEIDPDVYFIADKIFTFLKNTKGRINFIFGDARVKIKEQPAGRYDILVVDAFSGDAIPVHLLTTEAIDEYHKHLSAGGVILFHISNRYLNFIPVLFSNAEYLGAYSCFKNNIENNKLDAYSTSWFAVTWDKGSFNRLLSGFNWNQYVPGKKRLLRPWTDKYSDMLLILDLKGVFSQIRYFQPFYW